MSTPAQHVCESQAIILLVGGALDTTPAAAATKTQPHLLQHKTTGRGRACLLNTIPACTASTLAT